MSLTVADVLSLDAFKTFRLVAGEKGLSRELNLVGILDYEVDDIINENFKAGEFVLTNLMSIKDDLSKLEEMVARLIHVQSAGFAIKTIYVSEIPAAVIELCNREGYPLFLFEDTFVEVIITSVNDLLRAREAEEHFESQIDRILSGDMNKYGVRQAALMLHRGFGEFVLTAYVKAGEHQKAKAVPVTDRWGFHAGTVLDRRHRCLAYRGGHLVIVTSDSADVQALRPAMNHALNQLGFDREKVIGYSRAGQKLDRLDLSIQEALYAHETASLYQLSSLSFSEMGLDRMLLPVKDNPWVMAYYESVMDPIISYDQKNGTDLLRTAVVYILSGGDIKRSADRLFQHGNTVRYRMERIRQLISSQESGQLPEDGLQTEWAFYELLAVGVRLHLIYTGSL